MAKDKKTELEEALNFDIDSIGVDYVSEIIKPSEKKETKPATLKDTAPKRKNICVNVGIYLDKSLYKELKVKAVQEDSNINRIIERLIREYLQK